MFMIELPIGFFKKEEKIEPIKPIIDKIQDSERLRRLMEENPIG